jgi:hypothetical protein
MRKFTKVTVTRTVPKTQHRGVNTWVALDAKGASPYIHIAWNTGHVKKCTSWLLNDADAANRPKVTLDEAARVLRVNTFHIAFDDPKEYKFAKKAATWSKK